MSENISERNQKFLNSLQGNIGKYLSFLSTMARFHKYDVTDLTSFAIEAPAMFTAVASKELWERHFRRKIKSNAKGVTLIKDGKETVYYDVSETESTIKDEIEVKLWHFDNSVHKKFLDAVVSDEKSTEKQIKIIAEELANRSNIDDKSKKLLALSVESVILERMEFSTENATRQLARISFKDHDIPKILYETQATAKIFLDAMQKSLAKNTSENLDVPENNPLLEKIGVIKISEKIQEPELKLEIQEETVQNGLFDDAMDVQLNSSSTVTSDVDNKFNENAENPAQTPEKFIADSSEENVLENVTTIDENSASTSTSTDDNNINENAENISEEILTLNPETIEEKIPDESPTIDENSESTTTSDIENNFSEPTEKIGEEISTQKSEVVDAEIVAENPVEIFETNEQSDPDYDFEEMDEEDEILPDISESQNDVEILPEEIQQPENEFSAPTENVTAENNSEKISAVEEISTETLETEFVAETSDEIKPDFQTILAEDMAVIRGNSFEKNIFRKNVTAIRTLQRIENENRTATPEEIEILKNYSGFGGIPKAFDKNDPNWNREAWLLQSMLTDKEYSDARGSTLNAHFTSKEIVQGIYGGLKNLGFNQGTILEPSMGVGGFFGNMPDEMKNGSHLYGVELDSLTGRIAQKIYSDAEISVKGFEDTRYLNNSFDIAVRNVPFGNYRVNDKGYNENRFLIHDYFIAKMIDQVRPGGIVAVITSRGTLDKQDKSARKYFARRADLVRAIRLPNNAFKEAGTEVTSDILFFKKLENIRDDENLPNWVNVTSFQDEQDITVNNYFSEHPEDVLGTLDKTSTAYGFDLTCKPDENRSLAEMLNESMQSMQKIYSPSETPLPLPKQIADIDDDKHPSSFFIENGELKFYNGVKTETIKVTAKDRSQILLAMDLCDSVRNVINIQVDDRSDDELQKAHAKLNELYDNYVKTYGHICEDSNLKKIFSKDSAYPLLRSLEEYGKDGYNGKSPIFSKRMIEPHRRPTYADNPADALAISMQEVGYVDLDYMKSLTQKSEEEIIKALEFERIFFDFQNYEFQLAEEFLSGDVRAKIEFLEHKIKNFDFEVNKKIAESVLHIPPVPAYEPKNELERKILNCNPDGDRYFSFSRFYDDNSQKYYDDYIETQKDNRDFLIEVALRQGISMYTDKIGEILSDKPLIALEAIRRGRDVGYVRQADLLINGYLRTLDEEFSRTDAEHDLLLYSFLKKNLAKFENNLDAIKAQVDNFYQSIGADELKMDWENFKADYQNQKNIELDKLNPELDFIRSQKSRLEKNLVALEKVKPKDLSAADIHVEIGATWIPTSDIRQFINETFDVNHRSLEVHFSQLTGLWRIDGKTYPNLSAKAEVTYGLKK